MMLGKALIKREEDVLVSGSKVGVLRAVQSASLSLGITCSFWQESIIPPHLGCEYLCEFPELQQDVPRIMYLNGGIS